MSTFLLNPFIVTLEGPTTDIKRLIGKDTNFLMFNTEQPLVTINGAGFLVVNAEYSNGSCQLICQQLADDPAEPVNGCQLNEVKDTDPLSAFMSEAQLKDYYDKLEERQLQVVLHEAFKAAPVPTHMMYGRTRESYVRFCAENELEP